MEDDLVRAFALERRFLEVLSTRTEPFAWGKAFFDEEYRERFVSNVLVVGAEATAPPADGLLDAAERILGGAGYRHRNVVVQRDEHGVSVAEAFSAAGYRTERYLTMGQSRTPDAPASHHVEEATFSEVRPLILEIYRRDPQMKDESVISRFTEQHGKYERVAGARFFTAGIDGKMAGVCELWCAGAEAIVDHVDTLEEYRNRGIARSVVLRAAEVARAEGAGKVFIVADEDDWPRHLYERLGFDVLGRSWQFLRWPDEPG